MTAFPAPLRLAFVGAADRFQACALDEHSAALQTAFFDPGSDHAVTRSRLDDFAPHVVVAFAPDELPAALLDGLAAAIVGYVIDPAAGRRLHRGAVDRLISVLPPAAGIDDDHLRIWRSMPLPVADRLFRPVRRAHGIPGMLSFGAATVHRERYLVDVKQRFVFLHETGDRALDGLERALDDRQIAFNMHDDEDQATFESVTFLHLAAGQLLISEPLTPTHGLEPGFDFLEISHPDDLLAVATEARAFPDAHHRMRVRGRRKAEAVRASRVWPALIRLLLIDLAANGSPRHSAARGWVEG